MLPDSPLHRRYDSILDGLRRLQRSRAGTLVFGANAHQFKLNPPLRERAIAAFEADHRIDLPEDYRGFLMHVGDGGAGPFHGVFRLGEMDEGHGYARWTENNGFVGVLSLPFPHHEPWNDLSEKPDFDQARGSDQKYEDAYSELVSGWEEKHYWDTRQVNGAMPICHLGCARRQWLIVAGPEAGHIWGDDRADEKGLYPLSIAAKQRVSFLDWYCAWLDDALRIASLT